MRSVVTTRQFDDDALKLLGDEGMSALIWYLATHPLSGDVIPATGGARKLRWSLPGKGKRGGTRTIYFFGGEDAPVFAIAIYGKGAKSDLTEEEKKYLKDVVAPTVRAYSEDNT